jgi:hypothetical protein
MLFRFLILAMVLAFGVCGSELPRVQPVAVGLYAEVMERIRPRMESIVEDGKVAGAVTMVAKDGKVAYADSVGMRDRERGVVMTEDTIFRIHSMSKPVTGVALMVLFDEGKFRLEDAVCGAEGLHGGRVNTGGARHDGSGADDAHGWADLRRFWQQPGGSGVSSGGDPFTGLESCGDDEAIGGDSAGVPAREPLVV